MKAKVVHIVTRLDFGGAQQNTLYTVEHLDAQRFETVLLCGPGGRLDERADHLAEKGVRVRFIEDLVREISPLRDCIAYFQLYAALKREKPDIVHTHSSKAGILGRIAAQAAGVPVIIHTFHGFGFHEHMRRPVRAFYVLHERIAAALCRKLIFVSRANMDYARAYGIGNEAQYELIRSGVALSALPAVIKGKSSKRRELGLPEQGPLITTIGNLKPQKNFQDFLNAARSTHEKCPDAVFAFVGDGPGRGEFLRQIKNLGLEGRAFLLGWRADAPDILAASDIFFLTSLWEGLPRSLVEAMKSGLPCVAYAVDGVMDLIVDGRNGYIAAPKDWETAANRLMELIHDENLRKTIGRAAQASVGPEFDIDNMVRRQEELYADLTL